MLQRLLNGNTGQKLLKSDFKQHLLTDPLLHPGYCTYTAYFHKAQLATIFTRPSWPLFAATHIPSAFPWLLYLLLAYLLTESR